MVTRNYDDIAKQTLDTGWSTQTVGPKTASVEQIQAAMLMDIAASLRAILQILRCQSTQMIPHHLAAIERNTKPKPKAKSKPKHTNGAAQ